jgi:MORN repeat
MGEGRCTILTGVRTPETGSMDAGAVKVALPLSMATFTLDNMNEINDMDMDGMNGLMAEYMTVVFDVTIAMDLEPTAGQTDPRTRVNSSMDIVTVKERIDLPICRFTRESGRMGSTTDKENVFGQMVSFGLVRLLLAGLCRSFAKRTYHCLLFVLSAGRTYRGEWQDGKAHGYGVEHRPDGSIRHEGEWKKDRPIRPKLEP